MSTTTTDLDLSLIVRDPEIQPRERMDHDTVTQYAEDMLAGIAFPPVVVFHDGDRYWLSQGFHRCAAAEQAGWEVIEADVRPGTRQDAVWDASGSNKEFDTAGLKRKSTDKRRAVEMALQCRKKKTDEEIADHCGVHRNTVLNAKKHLAQIVQDDDTRTVTRNGKTYEMDVSRIGSNSNGTPKPLPGQKTFLEEEPEADTGPEIIPPEEIKPTPRPVFNITNEMVDWARWTWNPVTGCEHNCVYCYARDIANRFYPEKFAPTPHWERLDAPRNTKKPGTVDQEMDPIQRTAWRNVFVCSMADLFGRWVPDDWIERVFDSCRQSPEWNYLFLTKFPQRYVGLKFPDTSWVGTSVDEQKRVANAEKAFRKIDVPVKWLSVEPMREPIEFTDLSMFDWVVIGGQSRSSGAPEFHPDPRWVYNLVQHATDAGCKVYLKANTFAADGWRIKEYPYA